MGDGAETGEVEVGKFLNRVTLTKSLALWNPILHLEAYPGRSVHLFHKCFLSMY